MKQVKLSIQDIQKKPNTSTIKAFGIDAPVPQNNHASALTIAGWIVPEPPFAIPSIDIINGEFLLKRIPLNIARPDVENHLNTSEPSEHKFGFHTQIGILGLPKSAQIKLVANIYNPSDQSRQKAEICILSGKRERSEPVKTKYQPVAITAIGRSGTTLLMQALSEHQEILTSNFYPYEVKQTSYWMHLLKVLTDPADFENSSHPDSFERNLGLIGHNPYSHQESLRQFKNPAEHLSLYTSKNLTETIRFCTSRIDDFYDLIKKDEKKSGANLFAEKFLPTHIQSIIEEVYTAPKEIILTRDFRDMICSARSFNSKRNNHGFGRDRATDEQDWVRRIFASGARSLARAWEDRRDSALHIKYEDLITSTESTLSRIFDYLEIDRSPATIKRINKIIDSTENTSVHITSPSAGQSISRWRADMPEDLLAYCNGSMRSELELFGYTI